MGHVKSSEKPSGSARRGIGGGSCPYRSCGTSSRGAGSHLPVNLYDTVTVVPQRWPDPGHGVDR